MVLSNCDSCLRFTQLVFSDAIKTTCSPELQFVPAVLYLRLLNYLNSTYSKKAKILSLIKMFVSIILLPCVMYRAGCLPLGSCPVYPSFIDRIK